MVQGRTLRRAFAMLLFLGGCVTARQVMAADPAGVVSATLEAGRIAWERADWPALGRCISDDAFVLLTPSENDPDSPLVADKKACLDFGCAVRQKHETAGCEIAHGPLLLGDEVAITCVEVRYRTEKGAQGCARLNLVFRVEKKSCKAIVASPGFFDLCVEVVDVLARGEAAEKGVQAGDILLSYDGAPTTTAVELSEAVKRASRKTEHSIVLLRDGIQKTLAVKGGALGIRIQDAAVPAAGANAASSVRCQLEDLLLGARKAINAADVDGLASHFSERAFVWVGYSSRFLRGPEATVMDADGARNAYKKEWAKRTGKLSAETLAFPRYRVIHGGGFALLDVDMEAQAANGRDLSGTVIALAAREKSGWKVVAVLPPWFRIAGAPIELSAGR